MAGRLLVAAARVLRHDGIRGMIKRLRRHLFLRELYYVYVRSLEQAERIPFPRGLTAVRRATSADRNALAGAGEDFGAMAWWDAVDPEADCYVGLDGERLVAVHWVSTDKEVNGLVPLEEGDFVIGPCATAPSHRGRGIYPAVLSCICAERRSRGERRAFMVVAQDNHASIRGIEKAGFRRAGEALLIRRMGRRRVERRFDSPPVAEGDTG